MDLGTIIIGIVVIILGFLAKTLFTNPSWTQIWWIVVILGVIAVLWGLFSKK
jgi:hypothetical protein